MKVICGGNKGKEARPRSGLSKLCYSSGLVRSSF